MIIFGAGVIKSVSRSDNDIRISKVRCILLDCGLRCEKPVVWDTGRK